MNKKSFAIIFFCFLSVSLLYSHAVQAINLTEAFGNKVLLNDTGLESYYAANSASLETRIGNVVEVVLSLVGVIFLILIIYSGLRWMTAGGNDQTLDKAKESLRQAIMGLIIVVGAYAISLFIFNSLN